MDEVCSSISRRKLMFLLGGLFAGAYPWVEGDAQRLRLRRKKPVVAAAPVFVYFGTDTAAGISKGIYLSRFDPATGHLTEPVLVAAMKRPSFFAAGTVRGTARRVLYAAAEGSNEANSLILSFLIDPKTGSLTPLNQVSAGGVGPAYVSVDPTGQAAFAANYSGGTVATYHVLADGKLAGPVDRIDFHDAARFGPLGPNAARQEGPHPHSAIVSPDDRFLLVNDLGKDAIDVFPIDLAGAHLEPMEPHRFSNNRPGSGPRHVAFHPNGRWVYSLNEIDATIDRFLWETTHKQNESQAVLIATQSVTKLLDPSYTGKNKSAEVVLSPDGQYLYASNRGEDTLVVFAINQESGDLTLVQRIGCGGKAPRQFTLSPSAGWLVCGNQDSATVTVFKRDAAGGRLTGPVQTVALDSVMMTLFV